MGGRAGFATERKVWNCEGCFALHSGGLRRPARWQYGLRPANPNNHNHPNNIDGDPNHCEWDVGPRDPPRSAGGGSAGCQKSLGLKHRLAVGEAGENVGGFLGFGVDVLARGRDAGGGPPRFDRRLVEGEFARGAPAWRARADGELPDFRVGVDREGWWRRVWRGWRWWRARR